MQCKQAIAIRHLFELPLFKIEPVHYLQCNRKKTNSNKSYNKSVTTSMRKFALAIKLLGTSLFSLLSTRSFTSFDACGRSEPGFAQVGDHHNSTTLLHLYCTGLRRTRTMRARVSMCVYYTTINYFMSFHVVKATEWTGRDSCPRKQAQHGYACLPDERGGGGCGSGGGKEESLLTLCSFNWVAR